MIGLTTTTAAAAVVVVTAISVGVVGSGRCSGGDDGVAAVAIH